MIQGDGFVLGIENRILLMKFLFSFTDFEKMLWSFHFECVILTTCN